MTDTAAPVAPNPTPQAQTEVPINPDPPSSPNPLGPQAPQAPVKDLKGSEHRPPSRREALQAAFDRATRQQDGKEPKTPPKTPPKIAEAKKGHNAPPEPTEAEPKLNLKKRPEDQDERPRGERGRFAPRTSAEPSSENSEQIDKSRSQDPANKPGMHKQLPENAPFREPPPRMADHAKAEWATAPESVRGEVHRMHQEFAQAYNAYKGAYDAFMPVAHFHKMAADHGTTLERALANYTSMEQKLRSDVVGGLDVIVNNLNLRSPDGQKLGLRDIAYHVLSQTPEQLRQIQMGNHQTAASSQIGALHQKIDVLQNALQQMHTAQQFTYTRSQVDQFAASHPRFDELGTLIERELQFGFDLETAYRRAELLQPATRAVQTGNPAAQTRPPADRSISGSPGFSGSQPTPRRNEKPVGRREAIANAIKRVNGGV